MSYSVRLCKRNIDQSASVSSKAMMVKLTIAPEAAWPGGACALTCSILYFRCCVKSVGDWYKVARIHTHTHTRTSTCVAAVH